MSRLYLLLPGDLAARTGGTIYDRRIAEGLRRLGWDVRVRSLADSFPQPTAAALADAARVLAEFEDHALVLIDGLALGAMPGLVEPHRERLRLVALLHHPLALEIGLDAARASELRRLEAAALGHVRRVIVTSAATARLLDGFGVDADAIRIVEPGTDPAPAAEGSRTGPLRLLCVGTITPRKGHRLLIEALSGLRHLDWTLTCAGSLTRCPESAALLLRAVGEHGLRARVQLPGEVDEARLASLYASADLFVLPSLYEGYGMAYAEALARGLPVLGTTAGAIPDTVPADAGVLVPPGSVPALAAALERLLTYPALRRRLAEGARRARDNLPDWSGSARRFAEALTLV